MSSRLRLIGILTVIATVVRATVMSGAMASQPPRPELDRAAIDELVLANRMLASSEAGVFDTTGDVSVRSPANPTHFFIGHAIPPGIVTAADIIEQDSAGNGPSANAPDQNEDGLIHAAIYKARPDVAAIVHARTPDVIAFSASTVPLYRGDDALPVLAVHTANSRAMKNYADVLGQAVVGALGTRGALLLGNDGAIVVGRTIYNVVSDAVALRSAAETQARLIAMGTKWGGDPLKAEPGSASTPPARLIISRTGGGFGGTERTWDYYKQIVMPSLTGPNAVPRAANVKTPPVPTDEDVIDDLVAANRIISYRLLGLVDALGHISVRSPRNPAHYYISRNVSAGFVTHADIIENDLDSKAVDGVRSDEFQEAYIHGEIYKARPDVIAVLHAHTPELRTFSLGLVTLRPIFDDAAFIGEGLPIHDIRRFDPRAILIRTPALGRSLAAVLGDKPGVLLKGHGIALTGSSLPDLVQKAYDLRKNAQIQEAAIALHGTVTYLGQGPTMPRSAEPRAWNYWKELIASSSGR